MKGGNLHWENAHIRSGCRSIFLINGWWGKGQSIVGGGIPELVVLDSISRPVSSTPLCLCISSCLQVLVLISFDNEYKMKCKPNKLFPPCFWSLYSITAVVALTKTPWEPLQCQWVSTETWILLPAAGLLEFAILRPHLSTLASAAHYIKWLWELNSWNLLQTEATIQSTCQNVTWELPKLSWARNHLGVLLKCTLFSDSGKNSSSLRLCTTYLMPWV